MKTSSKLLFWNIVYAVSIPFGAISLPLFLYFLFDEPMIYGPIKVLFIMSVGFGWIYSIAMLLISKYFATALEKKLEKKSCLK